MKDWNQQGDVIVEPLAVRGLKFPTNAKAVNPADRGFILAEGEVTGHAHALEAIDGVEVVEAPTKIKVLRGGKEEEEEVRYFVRVTNPKGARLSHEEHAAHVLMPGEYVVRGIREYDHFAEESRRVID